MLNLLQLKLYLGGLHCIGPAHSPVGCHEVTTNQKQRPLKQRSQIQQITHREREIVAARSEDARQGGGKRRGGRGSHAIRSIVMTKRPLEKPVLPSKSAMTRETHHRLIGMAQVLATLAYGIKGLAVPCWGHKQLTLHQI